jgi:putative membrane protein
VHFLRLLVGGIIGAPSMLLRALIAGFHYLALGIGMGAVVARGVRLRALRGAPGNAVHLTPLFRADSLWALAAGLWLATGLVRAFTGIEKAAAFYLRNGFFFVKMALFATVFALEIAPMVTFIKWRRARASGATPWTTARLDRLVRLNDAEVVLVILIPFAAALMARGAWLF